MMFVKRRKPETGIPNAELIRLAKERAARRDSEMQEKRARLNKTLAEALPKLITKDQQQ